MTEKAEENEEGDVPESSPSEQKPMKSESIGEMLAKARIAKGMSIDDIDRITHISPGWVLVIEQGAWSQYPSMVYAKGHVKVYAQLLGLDTDACAAQFIQEWNLTVKADPHENGGLQSQGVMQVRPAGPGPNYVVWGGVFLLLLLAVAAGVRYVMGDHESGMEKKPLVRISPIPAPIPPPPPPSTSSQNANISSSSGDITNSEIRPKPASGLKQVNDQRSSSLGTVPSHVQPKVLAKGNPLAITKGTLTLKIVALRSTWVVIGVDDGVVRRYHLNSGESRNVTGKNFMTLSTEYGNGLVLFLNGKRLGLAGPNPDPVLHRRLNRLSLRPTHVSLKTPQNKNGVKSLGQDLQKKGQVKGNGNEGKNSAPQTKVIPLLPSQNQENETAPGPQTTGDGPQSQSGRTP